MNEFNSLKGRWATHSATDCTRCFSLAAALSVHMHGIHAGGLCWNRQRFVCNEWISLSALVNVLQPCNAQYMISEHIHHLSHKTALLLSITTTRDASQKFKIKKINKKYWVDHTCKPCLTLIHLGVKWNLWWGGRKLKKKKKKKKITCCGCTAVLRRTWGKDCNAREREANRSSTDSERTRVCACVCACVSVGVCVCVCARVSTVESRADRTPGQRWRRARGFQLQPAVNMNEEWPMVSTVRALPVG